MASPPPKPNPSSDSTGTAAAKPQDPLVKEEKKSFLGKLNYRVMNRKAEDRLENSLPFLQLEIEYYESLTPDEPWIPVARDSLKKIENALLERSPEKGWKIYKEVARMILGADFKERNSLCMNRARAILNESVKKMSPDSWRLNTIVQLLSIKNEEELSKELKDLVANDPDKEKQLKALLAKANAAGKDEIIFNDLAGKDDIVYAAKLLDEHQDNFYSKLRIFKRRITILSSATIIVLIGWIVFAPNIGDFPYARTIKPDTIESQAQAFWKAVHLRDTTYHKLIAFKDSITNATLIQDNQAIANTKEIKSLQKKLTKLDSTVAADKKTLADSTKILSPAALKISIKIDTLRNAVASLDTMLAKKVEELKPKAKKQSWWYKRSRMISFWVMIAGFLGAVVSGFLRSIDSGTKSTIPNQMFGTTVLYAKLALSMVSALAIYIFLSTGVIFIFQGAISFELLLTFAFAAGFSERLVKGSIEKLTKEELYSGQKPK